MTGKNKPPVSGETLINKLPFSVVKSLSLRLDIDKQWERLVTKIPKRLTDVGRGDNCEMRYSHLQIRLFEERAKRPDGSPSNAILNDWATQNAKVKHLLRVLQEASLYEAADYLSENVLHQGKTPRLSDTEQNDTCPSLPHPAWSDGKKVSDEKSKISSTNFDSGPEKELYKRDKNMSCNEYEKAQNGKDSGQDSIYLGLVRKSEEENDYRALKSPSNDVGYHRGPSYTSGEDRSLLLEGGNVMPRMPVEQVDLESIYLKAKPEEEFYSYACHDGVTPKQDPCENSDEPKPDLTKTDIYKLIGPQKCLEYDLLQEITNGFDSTSLTDGGRLVGSGGFGEVFLGIFNNGHKVAVKKLKTVDEVDKQFQTELEALTKYRHKNIVCLYAYSVDGPGKCLVYEYLENGSLEDRLRRKDDTPPMPVQVRLIVLHGTAEGITFLNNQGIVHRDIKSANVLLDKDFNPKVGDFATARTGPRGNATNVMSTSVVIGTSAYLAPEARYFDVSTKLDSYSFGIIVLEVLTALPPLDDKRDEKDLKSYVEDSDIYEILDTSGGPWESQVVDTLMEISDKCSMIKKKSRCNVVEVLPQLESLCSEIKYC